MSEETTLAQRLFMSRACIGLNVDAFAELMGCDGDEYARYEEGEAVPSDDVLRKIALTYNISRNWIKTGEGEVYIDDEEEEEIKAEEAAALEKMAADQAEQEAAEAEEAVSLIEGKASSDSIAASKLRVIEKIIAMEDTKWDALRGILGELFER